VVHAKDDSSVCSRLRVYITPMTTPPSNVGRVPAGAVQYKGRGFGNYDPEKRECLVAAVNLPPRDDYWVMVDYPVRSPDNREVDYYFTGAPTLRTPVVADGLYPVKIIDKEMTNSTLSLSRKDQQLPGP